MLKIDKIEKNYNDFKLNCSLEVQSGCVTGLIGANGAGKSTTFKAILGLTEIDSGKITIFNKDIDRITISDKEDIGVVLAESGFSGYLSIKKIIPILSHLYHRFDKEYFLTQCKQFKLPLDKPLKDFSTGMRAKINLIIAISHDAKLLILDEPTAGLDVVARDDLLEMLRIYMEKENRSILISSHISSDLEGLCDDLYMIQNGAIIFHEDTDVLLGEYGTLKLDEKQFEALDKTYLIYAKKESFGYQCLTKYKQFYLDNYPDVVVEKGNIDDVVTIIEKGDKLC